MERRILVIGPAGERRTAVANGLSKRLKATHFDGPVLAAAFGVDDKVALAQRLGWLCERVVHSRNFAIAEFDCATPAERTAFGDAFVVWVDSVPHEEAAAMGFVPPEVWDVQVTNIGAPEAWVEQIVPKIVPVFNTKAPTALFLGRYQPFHDGHRGLILEGIKRVGQAVIAVRDTQGTDAKNPYGYEDVKARIEIGLADQRGRFIVLPVPNITNIFYGRDVGYQLEYIDLDPALQDISATKIRKLLEMPGTKG